MSIKYAKIISIGANPEEYHKDTLPRGSAKRAMSSSSLRVFDACPLRWVNGYESPDSDAKDYGNLLDVSLLTPQQFEKRFAVKPLTYRNEDGEEKPWNGNAKVCKAWLLENEGKQIVSENDLTQCSLAIERLREDETIAAFLDASDKQVHVEAVWVDEATGFEIPLKGLIDLLPRPETEFCKCIGDLKTTRNASPMAWQRWCFQAGYHIQSSLYVDMVSQAEGGSDRNTFCFILSENFPPYQTGKRMGGQQDGDMPGLLDFGRMEYQRILANYCQCLKTGIWPGYDDHDEAVQGWSIVRPDPYMMQRQLFAPTYAFGEEPPVETETKTDPDLIP